jgi:hypothetical protein
LFRIVREGLFSFCQKIFDVAETEAEPGQAQLAGPRAQVAGMRTMEVWYSLVEAQETLENVENKKVQHEGKKTIDKALSKDSLQALDRLAVEVDGEYQIRHDPPMVVRVVSASPDINLSQG